MQRFLMNELVKWKEKSNRKPLILKGARQVGKTWLLKEFGRTHFKKTAYVSFYNNQRMKNLFEEDFDKKQKEIRKYNIKLTIIMIVVNMNIETYKPKFKLSF